jgi:hypothetical protein
VYSVEINTIQLLPTVIKRLGSSLFLKEGTFHHFPRCHDTWNCDQPVSESFDVVTILSPPHPFQQQKSEKNCFVSSSLAYEEDTVCETSYEGVFLPSPALLPFTDMIESLFIFVSILLLTCHYFTGYRT